MTESGAVLLSTFASTRFFTSDKNLSFSAEKILFPFKYKKEELWFLRGKSS